MKDSAKTLLGFAAGVAVGAGMYAFAKSEKGQKLMKEVGKKMDDLGKEVRNAITKGKHYADDMAKKVNATAKEAEVVG
jgi:cytochrome c556